MHLDFIVTILQEMEGSNKYIDTNEKQYQRVIEQQVKQKSSGDKHD